MLLSAVKKIASTLGLAQMLSLLKLGSSLEINGFSTLTFYDFYLGTIGTDLGMLGPDLGTLETDLLGP